MKKIFIIGCGFAGVSAARVFRNSNQALEITVIDRKTTFDFLPMLPDIVGRGADPKFLAYPINELRNKLRFNFVNEEVKAIDLGKNKVHTQNREFVFDYLIIASGSQTNFYGNQNIRQYGYKLNSVQDAKQILQDASGRQFKQFIVAGAGYTGIEIATSLRVFLNKTKQDKPIIILEKAPQILGPLPGWMKDYTLLNLKRLNIDLRVNLTAAKAERRQVVLSDNTALDEAMLIWVAGVETADFLQNINASKNPQGRIKVDEYLKLTDNCFVAGDAAYLLHRETGLRMAVQFSISQGRRAAGNILRAICGRKLKKYIPFDLGYLIPMANNLSCGNVLGVDLAGRLATLLHYFLCFYRLQGMKNKFGVFLKRGGAQ